MACSAVMVPTTMFMGQVVTAYSPFPQQQGQTQTIALQTQSAVPAEQQAQATTLQTSQQQGATQQTTKQQQPFLQVTKHAHSFILNLFRTVIHVHKRLNVNTPLVTFHIFLTDYSKSCLQILNKLIKNGIPGQTWYCQLVILLNQWLLSFLSLYFVQGNITSGTSVVIKM